MALSVVLDCAGQSFQPLYVDEPDLSGRDYSNVMDDLAVELESLFGAQLGVDHLLDVSRDLKDQYLDRLQSSNISMLPSYQHTLPTGREVGDYLALDVGGSTLRIAIIRLGGRKNGTDGLQVRRIRSFSINNTIRHLRGRAFFDWMADKIGEMLMEYNYIRGITDGHLSMGLAWSFPVEQTSPRSGRLLAMGKGFCATDGVLGEDLGELLMTSCRERGLNVTLGAIVNDGAATLLAQAYRDASTRMSLILGTGTNAAVFLPVSALGISKFGDRPDSWHASAEHVLVNTEMSMFGKGVLPVTRWDDELNANHTLPDFQPLEYLTTGRYLGEIVRLILFEAVDTAGLFGGRKPPKLVEPYTLDTQVLSAIECDASVALKSASKALVRASGLPAAPHLLEMQFVQQVCKLVSRRATRYLAAALHALWALRTEAEGLQPGQSSDVTIACHGTVVEKYPGFRAGCQWHLDELCVRSGAVAGAVTLAVAPDSSIFGAAVAVCCTDAP